MKTPSWRHPRFQRQTGELSMTSMIDVVFLLLIFFVCTVSFQASEMILPSSLAISGSAPIEVELPPPEELEEVVVEVRQENGATTWRINERDCSSPVELQQLLLAYADVDSTLPVIVDCDDRVSLAAAIETYDLARGVGLTSVQFAAEAE